MEKLKFALLLILFVSCRTMQQTPADCLVVTVVNKTGLDGCSYLLETENHTYLEADNLAEKFRKDGLKVCITFKKVNTFSVCMAGEMITLTSIRVIK